jgi:hypothetical protein
MTTAATWLPARADLDAATARTAAAIGRGAALADVERAAELEATVHEAYLARPDADAELQAEAELEVGGADLEQDSYEDGERCPRCHAVSWGMTPDGRVECTRCLSAE